MGDVIGDLNSRRGLVGEFLDKPGNMRVRILTSSQLLPVCASDSWLLRRCREPHYISPKLPGALHP